VKTGVVFFHIGTCNSFYLLGAGAKKRPDEMSKKDLREFCGRKRFKKGGRASFKRLHLGVTGILRETKRRLDVWNGNVVLDSIRISGSGRSCDGIAVTHDVASETPPPSNLFALNEERKSEPRPADRPLTSD